MTGHHPWPPHPDPHVICSCGHERQEHNEGGCSVLVGSWSDGMCPCLEYAAGGGGESEHPEADVDLVLLGAAIADEVDRIWPRQTMDERGMALAEEAGEVNRALLKRNHTVRYGGTFKGKTTDDWRENLRIEVAQTIGVALDIAHREGFNVTDDLVNVLIALRSMPGSESSDG